MIEIHGENGKIGEVALEGGKVTGSTPAVRDVVGHMLRKHGSPQKAFRAMAAMNNGYVWAENPVKIPSKAQQHSVAAHSYGIRDGVSFFDPTVAGAIAVQDLMIKAVRRDGSHAGRWDPIKHPRDRHGRFIETGARVRLLDGTLATVTRSLGGGRVEVRRGDGRLEDTSAHTVQVVKPGEGEGAGGARLPKGRPLIVTHGPADTPVIGQVTGTRDHLAVTTASGSVHYIPHKHVNRVYEAHDGKPARVHYTRPGFHPRPEDDTGDTEVTPVAAGDLREGDHALLPHPVTGRAEPGTVIRADKRGDRMDVDVRRADGTVDTADLSRHEQVDKITSPVSPDDFPGDMAGTPVTARPPAAVKPLPDGTATARPVLYTYQRDTLTTLNLDRDRTLPDPVRQAAARLRQRQPLSAEQATALASHLRYDASEQPGVTPARKRALERTATRLDAAAAEIHGQPTPHPSPLIASARRVTSGDLTAGDTVAIQTSGGIITAKVHGTRSLMGGRVHELELGYGDGGTQVRAYTGKTPMWLLPDLPDDQPRPPSGPTREHITLDRIRIGDTLQKGDRTAKVTAVKPEKGNRAWLSFDDGDSFPFSSSDGGPAVIRTARGPASAGQPWDTVMLAEHPEQVKPGDLQVGDRISRGTFTGTIEHLEAVTGEDGTPGARIRLRDDDSTTVSIDAYGDDKVTRLVKADANAAQRIEAARLARQEAMRAADIRELINGMLRDALEGDLARLDVTIGHSSDDLMRTTISAEPASSYAKRTLPPMITAVIPNDPSMDVLVAARKEATARLEPALTEMVQRQRDNLLTSLVNASVGLDSLDPANGAKITGGRQRVAEQFLNNPPPVDTGQVAAALAAAVTVMRNAENTGPLPAPEVPQMPDGASVRDRMAGYRAALPADPAAIGRRLVSRAMYQAPRLEDLEAGKIPAVKQAAIAIPDRAPDGGPGEVAMRHLDIVTAAGRDLDAELQRRLATRGMDAVSVNARHEELTGVLAAKKAARDEYARAHGYDSYLAALNARYDSRRDRSKDAEVIAVISGAKDSALPHERRIEEITADPAYSTKAAADALRETAMEVLNEARADGLGGHGAAYRKATGDKGPLTERSVQVKAMRWAEQHYPRGWLEKYAARTPGGYRLGDVKRGHYNDSVREIRLSASSEKVTGAGKSGRVAVHEAGHAMEQAVPGVRALQNAYLWSRTSSGDDLNSRKREARQWLGGTYDKGETAYFDEFPERYSGKDYPPYGYTPEGDGLANAYELLTTGMESLMAGSSYLDDSFRQWLLGTLALVD